jgi:hypothetical protein
MTERTYGPQNLKYLLCVLLQKIIHQAVFYWKVSNFREGSCAFSELVARWSGERKSHAKIMARGIRDRA